jgi:hypothetical protein
MLGIAGCTLLVVLALMRRWLLHGLLCRHRSCLRALPHNIEAHILHVWCVYCVSSLILIVVIAFLAFAALIFDRPPVTSQ